MITVTKTGSGNIWLHPKGTHWLDKGIGVCILSERKEIRCFLSDNSCGDWLAPKDETLSRLLKQEAWEQVWDRLLELELIY